MNSIKKLVASLEPYYSTIALDILNEVDSKDSNDFSDSPFNDLSDDKIDPSSSSSPSTEYSFPSKSRPRRHLATLLLRLVAFFPYHLVIRPVLLVWLLVTFPFTYIFGHDYPAMLSVDDTLTHRTDEKPLLNEKTELLKQEKILANNIKSPTGLSKYIIPPPPRLIPLSRNPDKKKRKKVLVLDLDETLIHSLPRAAPRSLGGPSGSCHGIEIRVNDVATLYNVYKRPYCDFFLKEISKWFELQIFTASVREYADPIIDWLEADIIDYKLPAYQTGDSRVFTKRYYRADCTYRPGVGYIKDLSKFFPKDDDLKNVLILDNSPISYALHEHNAVMIEGWINDQKDRDLINLLPLLYSLSFCIDVRFIMGLRSGEKLFENLTPSL